MSAKNNLLRKLMIALIAFLALFLSSCYLHQGGELTETAAPPVPSASLASPQPTDETVSIPPEEQAVDDLTPVLGSTMLWFDTSAFVYVPPGEFVMGQDEPQPSDHAPAHEVNLSGFWIHQTEVTNDQYRLCVATGVCSTPAKEANYLYRYADPKRGGVPVVGVDWNQAQTYCVWIGARLPTEAEWEKAARGVDGWRYPWGDSDPSCTLANYRDCLEPPEPFLAISYAEGNSPFKLLNTAGNVFEWTDDWYSDDYYSISPIENPLGAENGTQRVIRGGSFLSVATDLAIHLRDALEPEQHRADLGFRCVLRSPSDLGTSFAPACEMPPVFPYFPQPEERAVEASGVGYCEYSHNGGYMETGINILITEGLSDYVKEDDYIVWAGLTPLDCYMLNESAPFRLACVGLPYNLALAPNSNINIDVCQYGQFYFPDSIQCPALYVYDPLTELCYYAPTYDPVTEGCPLNYVEISPGECVLKADGTCPNGYSIKYINSEYVCVPWDDCVAPGAALSDPACRRCLDGSIYDPERNCCASEYPPRCPNRFFFHEESGRCGFDHWFWEKCKSLDVHIPVCPTPMPEVCKNPEKYSNQKTCETAGCKWYPASFGQPYCGNP